MPGDVIDPDVWRGYQAGSDYSTTYGFVAMITSDAAAFGGVYRAGGDSGPINDAIMME